MKKRVLNGLLFGGIGTLAISSVAAVVLTSCTSSTPAQDATINLLNRYNDKIAQATNNTWFVTNKTKQNVLNVINKYLDEAKNLQSNIDKNGTIDEQIWIDSVIFQIEIEKASIDTEAFLLGASIGGNLNTAYNNEIVDYASRIEWSNDYDGWEGCLKKFISVTDTMIENLTEGVKKGITLSGVMTKMLVSDTLQKLYAPQLETFLKKDQSSITITKSNWKSQLGISNFFQTYVNNISSEKISNTNKTKLLELAKTADTKLDSYVDYLLNNYWTSVNYGWSTDNTFSLSVVNKGSTNEVTNTYPVDSSQSKTIKGLGLTQLDMNEKDIGIGFTPGIQSNKPGLNIYQNYLLLKNTTLYKSAATVNKLGVDNVRRIKNNMIDIDKYLASIMCNTPSDQTNWIPNGYTYDANIFDSSGPTNFSDISGVNGVGLATYNQSSNAWTVNDDQLKNFFKWLNCEQWFFGRDMATNQVVMLPKEVTSLPEDVLLNKGNGAYSLAVSNTNKGASYAFNIKYISELGSAKVNENVSNNFGDAGDLYQQYVVSQKGIAPGTSNINGAQAYVGASFSMDSYNCWKEAVLPSVQSIFIKSSDSNVAAPTTLQLNVNIITGTGGAAYANGKTFYLDVNPYYGLQKWSMTTLATHESLPGHNLQMIYAVDNTSSKDAPQLSYTSYAEGWGLFSEWLAVQYGSYGQPKDLTASEWLIPDKRMQLPNFDDNAFDPDNKEFSTVNINVQEANATTPNGEFMNGSFETNYNGASTTEASTLSQGYYNAMQYFGFLNERQLRAMRMVLDTSVHTGGLAINSSGAISNTNSNQIGTAAADTGWSLQDQINFMQANSGLGQGDVTREAQRYLNYTGQATSYLSGEIVIENLFGKACAAYETANDNQPFMDFTNLKATQNNTAPFFNLILRNNDIPLATLKKHVENYISKYIGPVPNTKA